MKKHTEHDSVPLGLWVYIMSDCVLFAALFATYAVLSGAIAGGPAGVDIFDRSFVLIETLILLTSSFTCGLALVFARAKNAVGTGIALAATLFLGLAFLGMELHEFAVLIADGHSWTTSAFLSAFFTLVGTHGLHILVGLMWIFALFMHLAASGLTALNTRRILYFSLFWHFLDIIWICIFSLVYLLGSL